MKQIEKFFTLETEFSKKHKLNTCNRNVPQDFLDRIESGCSLEDLESMMKNKFDIFKYATQITIHGIFPELSTRSIGGYVNLTHNKNKSVGVRYNAIDHEKKTRLYKMLKRFGWSVEENSQKYAIYKSKRLPYDMEEAKKIALSYKEIADKIDRSLFFGNVCCYLAESWGMYYVILDVNICCFYEKNFEKLFETLTGIPFAEGKEKYENLLEEEKRKREIRDAEYERELAKDRAEREKKKAEVLERKKIFEKENIPEGFVLRENYIPKNGDVIAKVYEDYNYNLSWIFGHFKMAFGKMNCTPCDADGQKTWKTPRTRIQVKTVYEKVFLKIA